MGEASENTVLATDGGTGKNVAGRTPRTETARRIEIAPATIVPAARSTKIGTFVALSAENIEPIDYVEHGVAVDTVIFYIGALHGVDGSAQVTLPLQYIVELQT